MTVKLANAPVSWGVDYPDDPKNPSWQTVMSEIREAGFTHTELGPFGFYPTDHEVLRREFASRDLTVTAGFVFEPLHDERAKDRILDLARRTVDSLVAVEAPFLVVIDHISTARIGTAGRQADAEKLDAPRFAHMIDMIDRIADVALEKGLTTLLHPHAGCYIEFKEEIEAVLDRFDEKKLGICLDTGHIVYAGIDPLTFYADHRSRVRHFHFKDINAAVHARSLREKTSFKTSVADGIFCPLQRGTIDWPAFAETLRRDGYDGVGVIEQDIDPTVSKNPMKDAKESVAYLRSVGF